VNSVSEGTNLTENIERTLLVRVATNSLWGARWIQNTGAQNCCTSQNHSNHTHTQKKSQRYLHPCDYTYTCTGKPRVARSSEASWFWLRSCGLCKIDIYLTQKAQNQKKN